MEIKTIEYWMAILRQVVFRAREAKEKGWTNEHFGVTNIDPSIGDVYEYSIKTAEELIVKIEKMIGECNEQESKRPIH